MYVIFLTRISHFFHLYVRDFPYANITFCSFICTIHFIFCSPVWIFDLLVLHLWCILVKKHLQWSQISLSLSITEIYIMLFNACRNDLHNSIARLDNNILITIVLPWLTIWSSLVWVWAEVILVRKISWLENLARWRAPFIMRKLRKRVLILIRGRQLGKGWSKWKKSEIKVVLNVNFRPEAQNFRSFEPLWT